MLAKKITSLQHPFVKRWVSLRLERTFREKTRRVLVSGENVIRELARPIAVLISTAPSDIPAQEAYLVSEAILKKITGLSQPDGLAAEVPLPEAQNLSDKRYLLILDQIADPGNLGTLLRTALALQWDGVIITPGTVDLFNDKALRAGKGTHFHLPFARLTVEEISHLKVHFYAADLHGDPLAQVHFQPPLALILSNEAHGSGDWSDCLARKITIPMNKKVESMNVAASGAILLYAMRPQ